MTITYFQKWYMDITKNKVKNNPDLTKELGGSKLSKLKIEVKNLLSQTKSIVNEFIEKNSTWWHEKPGVKKVPDFTESMSQNLRYIAGKLGPILEKYGYITSDPADPSLWREWDKMEFNRPQNARPFYPQHLDWEEPMRDMIAEYEELMTEGIHYSHSIKKLKKEKAQLEVDDLWEQA